jgi:hypothetical protein
MPRITLSPEEAERLHDVLEADLTQLRVEIADTDRREYRALLRRKEEFLESLLARLEREAA